MTAIVAALADTARELAQIAIDQAVVANVNPRQIADAQQKIQEGDARIASGDFVSAIESLSTSMAARLAPVNSH